MSTTDANRAAREESSRQVARDAAEAYKAAKRKVITAMDENRKATEHLRAMGIERGPAMRDIRDQAKQLALQARELGIPRSFVAIRLGVSRQTVYDWMG